MSAGDRDVDAGKLFLHIRDDTHHLVHQRRARLRVRRREIRLRHHQDVQAVGAGDSTIYDLCVAEARLQRQRLRHHQRAHADGISSDHILEHHAFRPGEFAPHHGQVFAHFGGRKFGFQLPRVGFGEKIWQRAGEQLNHSPLRAHLDAIRDATEVLVRGKPGEDFVRSAGERFGIVRVDADVQIDAVNLPELLQRVTILVHLPVIAWQHVENVLLQNNLRREPTRRRHHKHSRDKNATPMRDEPEIKPRVEIIFHPEIALECGDLSPLSPLWRLVAKAGPRAAD